MYFYYNDDKKKKISAGGVLFYYIDDGNMKILMSTYKDGRMSDFGGRINEDDQDINETIAREVEEETNGIYRRSYVLKHLKNSKSFYTEKSGYLIYLVKLDEDIDVKLFGDWEFSDDIPRRVMWIPYKIFMSKRFMEHKLAHRLYNKDLLKKINEINDRIK